MIDTDEELRRLLRAAPSMTPEEREKQRRSFAYGNAAASNPRVTRQMIDVAADILRRRRVSG